MTPGVLKDPVMTAQWEQRLEQIARGELTLDAFMQDQIAILPTLLNSVLSRPVALLPSAFPCPKCGKAMRKRPNKKYGGFFWACSDPDCPYPFFRTTTANPVLPAKRPSLRNFPAPSATSLFTAKKKRGTRIGPATTVRAMQTAKMLFFPTITGSPGKPKPRGTANCDGVRLPRLAASRFFSKLEQARREGLGTF